MKQKLRDIVDNQPENGDIDGYSYHNWIDVEAIQYQTVEMVLSEIEGYANQELSEYGYSESDSYHAHAHTIYGMLKDKLNQIREQIK